MATMLTALRVAGESFLLETYDLRILVDSGYHGKALATAIRPQSHINIAICTHADRDHAGGFTTLLSEGVSVGELWLPGNWANLAAELLLQPNTVANGLLQEIRAFAEDPEALKGTSEEIDDLLSAKANKEREAARQHNQAPPPGNHSEDNREATNSWFDELRQAYSDISEAASEANATFEAARSSIRTTCKSQNLPDAISSYWVELINTAERIRTIASEAIKYNVPVRWFDYEEFSRTRKASGGNSGFLEPLNSVELVSRPSLPAGLSLFARLTPVNEECLVFIYLPSASHIGVVFCGDSPMGDGPGYKNSFLQNHAAPEFQVIATAPHHGSENNSIAYQYLSAWIDVIGWLRTGGSKAQPGKTYKGLSLDKRACTHCPNTRASAGEVKIHLNRWPLSDFSGHVVLKPHPCDCK